MSTEVLLIRGSNYSFEFRGFTFHQCHDGEEHVIIAHSGDEPSREILRDLGLVPLAEHEDAVRVLEARVAELEAQISAPKAAGPAPKDLSYVPDGWLERLRAVGLEPLGRGEPGGNGAFGWWVSNEADLQQLIEAPHGAWESSGVRTAGERYRDGATLLLFRRTPTP